jgi:hypothetical protein
VLTPAAEVALANILTVECPCCGTRSNFEAPVPEVLARLAAIELVLREVLGCPC